MPSKTKKKSPKFSYWPSCWKVRGWIFQLFSKSLIAALDTEFQRLFLSEMAPSNTLGLHPSKLCVEIGKKFNTVPGLKNKGRKQRTFFPYSTRNCVSNRYARRNSSLSGRIEMFSLITLNLQVDTSTE